VINIVLKQSVDEFSGSVAGGFNNAKPPSEFAGPTRPVRQSHADRLAGHRRPVRLVRFGKVTLIDWLDTEDVYDARLITDVSVTYLLLGNASVTVGGHNIFNRYPTQQDTETETGGLWDAVQMGFSGAYYYARLNFKL
jgi:hypothetical protein